MCKYREFNLEEAKNGKPVITRNGRKVRIICFDRKTVDSKPLIVLVESPYNRLIETMFYAGINGKYYTSLNEEYELDLFMAPTKKEGWINIYIESCSDKRIGGCIYKTKSEAIGKAIGGYISTIKIKWEE